MTPGSPLNMSQILISILLCLSFFLSLYFHSRKLDDLIIRWFLRPSYLHNGISYISKRASLYWSRVHVLWRHVSKQHAAHDVELLCYSTSLHWCHNRHDGVSNHQTHYCSLNRLFRRRAKKTSNLRVTGFCAENSPGTGEFPAQMASNAENVSIWWRHHIM